ncbi:MAG TPA: hypothetical protein VF399_03670 [bacterium]
MDFLDKIPGIIGYAVINAEDGSIDEVKGSSINPLGDLAAFFSSAGEVIKNSLALGNIQYISLCYGAARMVIFMHDTKYLGIEVEREQDARQIMEKIIISKTEPVQEAEKPALEIPRNISSKMQQINLLIDEFGGDANRAHWLDILNQGLGILAGDLLPLMGLIEQKLGIKDLPPPEKEDDFVQALRTVIDFLVKKAVEEMGSSQARVKVQTVIEKMRQSTG